MNRFLITADPLRAEDIVASVSSSRCGAVATFIGLAAPAQAAEADLTAEEIHSAFIELCAKGQVATVAQCECALPKIVAATEPDDVPYYVTSWLLSTAKAAKIAARHPSGWTKVAGAAEGSSEGCAGRVRGVAQRGQLALVTGSGGSPPDFLEANDNLDAR